MKKAIVMVFGFAMLCAAAPANAQSANDFYAWIAMVSTPVGALPPVPSMATGGARASRGIVGRYGRWSFGPGDDETTTYGVGVQFRARRSAVRVDIGKSENAQCSTCGGLLLGLDITAPFRTLVEGEGARPISMKVEWNPVLGYMKRDAGDGTAMSAAINLPVTITFPVGSRWKLAPFVSPGFGVGMLSGGGDSESGFRPLIGGGVALSNARSTAQVTFGFRKIVLEGAPSTVGFGVALTR